MCVFIFSTFIHISYKDWAKRRSEQRLSPGLGGGPERLQKYARLLVPWVHMGFMKGLTWGPQSREPQECSNPFPLILNPPQY